MIKVGYIAPSWNRQMVTVRVTGLYLPYRTIWSKSIYLSHVNFCMLALLTGSRQDWVYVKMVRYCNDRSKGALLLWIICVIYAFCCHAFVRVHFLWSPAGKGLTSWLSFMVFYYVFVTFPCGILDQVWYLIVSIPDLCYLSHFNHPVNVNLWPS